MLPDPSRLREIAAGGRGAIADVPFAALLAALALTKRDAVLVLRRKRLERRIAIASGEPLDCRSNLLNETFGRFLVGRGKLSEEDFALAFSQSTTTKKRLGETLVERGLFAREEIEKLLQQNLARKLLDGFSWRDGTYEIEPGAPAVDTSFRVNVGQLILTGVSRFAVQASVDAAAGTLVGKRLAPGSAPLLPREEIRMNASQERVAAALEKRPRIDELAVEAALPFEEISRILYGFWLLGLVVTTDETPRREPVRAARPPAPPAPVSAAPAPFAETRVAGLRADFDRLRGADGASVLGISAGTDARGAREAFLARARAWAPWSFEGEDAETAAELFLAAARAWARLDAGLPRGDAAPAVPPPSPAAPRFQITTDVLDPEAQHRKGRELLAAGDAARALAFLEFAADCDPQNGTFAAEATWARYLASGRATSSSAIAELEEASRIDPACGISAYYLGEIHRSRGDHAKAEAAYRKAARLLAPDRRPLDALRDMAKERGKRA